MDIRSLIRPVIAGLVGLGLAIILIVLLVRIIFGHGTTPATTSIDVSKYASTSATVTLLTDDATNIDQDHNQVKIIISQNQNEIDILKGYQGTIVSSQVYPSNSAAFGAFLQSLKLLNFSRGNNSSSLQDYRGYCPTGDRYVYTFNDGQKDLFKYWGTSCGQGTFKGNQPAVLNLIKRQIPEDDFDTMTGSIMLGY